LVKTFLLLFQRTNLNSISSIEEAGRKLEILTEMLEDLDLEA
jgi:hypothetical protein